MSSPSTHTFSLYLLLTLFLLSLHAVFGSNPELFHICSTSNNFTANDPYESNLKRLTHHLSLTTPVSGFSLRSIGQDKYQTHGLSLCRGDVSAKDCKSCINDAKIKISNLCPNNKEAIIWYDNCLMKYSNEDFFGKIDNKNKFYLLNVKNASDPDGLFNEKMNDLLSGLSKDASVGRKKYAAGEMGIRGSEKIYGLAQCTRDLSGKECKKCIDGAIGELPMCCGGKQGGRVVGGSCMVRYEIYPFLNA